MLQIYDSIDIVISNRLSRYEEVIVRSDNVVCIYVTHVVIKRHHLDTDGLCISDLWIRFARNLQR